MVGLDETSMHTVHASYQYYAREIAWGARFADILSEAGEGVLVLDLSKFHETVPSQRTKDFRYPWLFPRRSSALRPPAAGRCEQSIRLRRQAHLSLSGSAIWSSND